MKKIAFLITGAASLALAACGAGNEDAVNNAEMNQAAPELNDLSSDAANDAANTEAAALGDQQNQLEQEPADNATTPTDEQEQNVAGM